MSAPSPEDPSTTQTRGEDRDSGDTAAPSRPQPRQVSFWRPRPSFGSARNSLEDKTLDGAPRRTPPSLDIKKAGNDASERSPLLPSNQQIEEVRYIPRRTDVLSPGDSEWLEDEQEEDWQETRSSWYLFLLTLAIGGLQIAWSVELSNGSPYLLSLGVSKSVLAFVWIAGPLSGTLVQPYVGIKSDRCRSRFGKRRPFMVGGAIATILSLMALAWTREMIGGILRLFGVSIDSRAMFLVPVVFAVVMVYILDFSINVIQAAIRAYIVDNAPTHQQDSANAWASRMSGAGNIIGYLFGYIDLPKYLWFFGDTQFKVLCVIASLAMVITLAISCLSIGERDPRLEGAPGKQEGGVFAFFSDLYRSMRKLPTQIRRVCQVQFFAWIGWFPFLFYITTYIGEMYTEPYYAADPNMSEDEVNRLWEVGTRMGTFALLIFALTTFAASIILPFLVTSSYRIPGNTPDGTGRTPSVRTPGTPGFSRPTTPGLRTPGTPGFMTPGKPMTPHTPGPGTAASGGYFAYRSRHHKHAEGTAEDYFGDAAPKSRLMQFVDRIREVEIPGFTLRRAWMLSHVLFAILCWLTLVVRDVTGATVLVALVGIPWAMTNWAPFALIAAEISKRDSIRRGLIPVPHTREAELLAAGEDDSEGADQAGVVLGIHNVAIAAPQVIATLVSSIIFRIFQKPRGVPDDSVAWVLRFGGLAALIAAYMTARVSEETGE